MNEKTNTQPTTTTKKLKIQKDTVRQLGASTDPVALMGTLACTTLSCGCTTSSSRPCC